MKLVESREEASQDESKSNQSDENEEESAEMRKMKMKMRLRKVQTRIQKLHEDLIIHSKNAKSFSQSFQKEPEAVNMLKGGRAGLATLSATCPQLGLQAAAKNARQVCASATTQKSARQVCAAVATQINALQLCASPQQNSWQIPLAESQECVTNTSSPNSPHENESGKEEQYEHGEEDGNEPETDPDEEVTTNSHGSHDVETLQPRGLEKSQVDSHQQLFDCKMSQGVTKQTT